jgi:hypothetical protein
MTHWKALLILSIGLSLQGCSTVYRQAGLEKVSRSEVAVIEVASCGDECPIIQEIDGAWRGMGLFKEYEVKPGTRTVKFIYVKGGLSGTHGLIVSFDAKQGEVYGVRANADHSLKKWRPEIIDKATGGVVSSFVGTGFAY